MRSGCGRRSGTACPEVHSPKTKEAKAKKIEIKVE
jgi:hypothetical protein